MPARPAFGGWTFCPLLRRSVARRIEWSDSRQRLEQDRQGGFFGSRQSRYGIRYLCAEGMPQVQNSQNSILARTLTGLAGLVIRHPWVTVMLSIVAAGASLALSTRMTYRTGRGDVINLKSEFNQRYLEYTREFGDKEDVVVVVHGRTREEIVPAMEEVSRAVCATGQALRRRFSRSDRLLQASREGAPLSTFAPIGGNRTRPDGNDADPGRRRQPRQRPGNLPR